MSRGVSREDFQRRMKLGAVGSRAWLEVEWNERLEVGPVDDEDEESKDVEAEDHDREDSDVEGNGNVVEI